MFKKLKQKYINKRLLKLVFADMYNIYEIAISKGDTITVNDLTRSISFHKSPIVEPFYLIYNKELDLLRDKLIKNSDGDILCSDLVREIYLTYGIFKQALC